MGVMRPPPRVLPALITPFGDDGMIDTDAHRHNLTTLAGRGVEGFVLCGSTGQGPYLVPGERNTLVSTARRTLGAEAYLLCGVQGESLAQALDQGNEAAEGGADALLVMTPTTLIRGNHEAVTLFYRLLGDRAPLPVFLYSVPATTGYQIPVEVTIDLASHSNILGIKDSGAEADRVPPLAAAIDSGFVVMAGSSRMVNEFVLNGAHGAITSSANYAFDLIVDAVADDEPQQRLTAVASSVEKFGLAGTYAAAEATGLIAGAMRLPLQPLEGTDRTAVADLVS
ncbi:MAG: dihydrodipicolinate synthase family protein [Acidobacteria bacterium]|nr:dihydrodipicolinate synthase family protein [Acidobacteriota bacterium]